MQPAFVTNPRPQVFELFWRFCNASPRMKVEGFTVQVSFLPSCLFRPPGEQLDVEHVPWLSTGPPGDLQNPICRGKGLR